MTRTSIIPLPVISKSLLHRVLLTFFLGGSLLFGVQADAQSAGQSGYSLIGTIQGQYFTGAVISVVKGEQAFYRLGDLLPDGSQLVKVRPNTILLKGADGTTYEMYILHDTKSVASAVRDGNPASPIDPSAPGAAYTPPAERPVRGPEKRRKNRPGNRDSDE